MNLKNRLERRTGPARTRFVWLNVGETQEAALARLELSSRHAKSVVFIRWMTESKTRAHEHA